MKKFIFAVFAALFLAGAAFCGGKADSSAPDHATGYIKWYGNAPMTYPGFVTDDGRIFSLATEDGSEITVDEITALQGRVLVIDGRIDRLQIGGFQVLKDGVFVVTGYKVK